MTQLVLSLFPGIGLLDMAFEEEGFCIVRGPDLLWGGDIKKFHPPAGKFDGVIGGPPCQMWARTANFKNGNPVNLIPEFERCVFEAYPAWFLMENVSASPKPSISNYLIQEALFYDYEVGGQTRRLRRFCFGSVKDCYFQVRLEALWNQNPEPAVIAGGSTNRKDGSKYKGGRNYGAKTSWAFNQGKIRQGLPVDFDLSPFTVKAKVAAIGNGVPLPMGRAVARAVKKALGITEG